MERKLARQVLVGGVIVGTGLLGGVSGSVQGQSKSKSRDTNYLEAPLPVNAFRLRYDAFYEMNRPDRAEFFFAQPQQLPGGGSNRNAKGLPLPETSVDAQEPSAYVEMLATEDLSVYVDLPFRFLNPELNENSSGISDLNVGFKYALLANDDQVATFGLRAYVPTGASTRGLGVNHVSLEPSLLCYQRLAERLGFHAEVRPWVPIGGTDFEGTLIRYGLGFDYALYETTSWNISPTLEFVGWSVLDGKQTADGPAGRVLDASGDNIFNVKVGVILGLGEGQDVSIAYGRALTGDVWYKEIVRVQYRMSF